MDPDQRAQSLSVAERLGATVYDLVVHEVSNLTPSMRRITLGAEGLASLGSLPGQDVMLSVPTAEGSWVRRRYSVRSFDPAAERIVLDVVAHGDGPGAHWAAGAAVGDVVEGIGPRGKVLINPGAAWHLFVGDESFTPAIFSMVEALTPATPAIVVIEVGGSDDELPLEAAACPDGPRWLHRTTSPGAPSAVVLDALRDLRLPSGSGFAYLGGEFHTVAAVRDLLVERGLDKAQISAKPYWRANMANASHGEPVKE
jgi:NADPH-dependent ferric siderophore reductase